MFPLHGVPADPSPYDPHSNVLPAPPRAPKKKFQPQTAEVGLASQLHVVTAKGHQVRWLTDQPAVRDQEILIQRGSWSPDSSKLAFLTVLHEQGHKPEGRLWIMGLGGAGLRQITQTATYYDPGRLGEPDPHGIALVYGPPGVWWSPDSKRIAFLLQKSEAVAVHPGYGPGGDEPRIYHQLCVANADGTEIRQLIPDERGSQGSPAWSPDGSQLLFVMFDGPVYPRVGTPVAIVVMDMSTFKTSVLVEKVYGGGATWSPDGRVLYWEGGSRIALMNADGTAQAALSGLPGGRNAPIVDSLHDFQWSADGTKVAFIAWERKEGSVLYAMKADGSSSVRLTQIRPPFAWWPKPASKQ